MHLHDLRFAFATAVVGSAVARRPLILHTHGLIFHTRFMERLKRLAVSHYFGPLLQASNAIIAASSGSDAALLLSLRPQLESRVRVVENAIPMETYLTIDRHPQRGELLVLGRIADSKRIDLVLRVLALMKDETWRLTIAGSGEARTVEHLRVVAGSVGVLDRVVFNPGVSESTKLALLSRAQLALFPSHGEGFGLALLEALASGVPVLAQDIPAHRLLLDPAHLTDFKDTVTASHQMRRLMAELPSVPAVRPISTRVLHFDMSRLVDEIEEIYQSLGLGIRPPQQQAIR